MRRLTSIVALNEEGAIGVENHLPWRIKTDMDFFRKMTLNNLVIMGRRTFDSLGSKCLPYRKNIVVTHGFRMFPVSKTCMNAGSINEALALASDRKLVKEEVFVIGGATMYAQFAPYADRYLITDVNKHVEKADTFFDKSLLGSKEEWSIKKIMSCEPNDQGDEVGFSIYEMSSKSPERFQRTRELALQSYRSRKQSASVSRQHLHQQSCLNS